MSGAIQATATAADQHQVEQLTVSVIPVVKEVARTETKELEVLVRVQAPTKATERAPIDIVAVLDVSDSMNRLPHSNVYAKDGEQSRLDLLKVAMKFVVSKLDGGDRLATVAFSYHVVTKYTTELVEISADRREAELEFVDSIVASNGTMFGPALEKAVETLDMGTDESRQGFILFLSDGDELMINEDNRKSFPEKYRTQIAWDELRADSGDKLTSDVYAMLRKYPVHAFGFSKFHDPKAMHAIARISGGTYSFLNDGLDKITQAFGFCLGGLQTVVAANIKINLAVQIDDPEIHITRIDSGGYHNSFPRDGKSGNITIPVLYAGEVKEFIVRLKVPPCRATRQLLLTADGKCATWGSDGRVRVDAQIPGHALNIERPEAVAKDQQQQDEKVVEQVLRFKLLEMLSDFLQEMKSKGVNLKKKKDTAADSLSGRWDRVKAENPSIADSLSQRYDEPVKDMVANLQNGDGDGGAFIYSFKSGTEMQRVTTKGSPDKVAEYKTPAMDKMGEDAQKPLAEILVPPPPEEGPTAVKKPALAPEYRPWPCACLEFDMIGQQLAYWAVVKRDLLRLVQQVEGNGGHHHLTGTFHDLELASINRAMYESVFLAVEHGHNLRRCYCAATGMPDLAACYDGEER